MNWFIEYVPLHLIKKNKKCKTVFTQKSKQKKERLLSI